MKAARRLFRLILLVLAVAVGALALIQRLPAPPDRAVPLPPLTGPIDRILVEKAQRRLTVFKDGRAVRIWRVALGFTPKGDKMRQGDGRTPEGLFRIDRRNQGSAFHLSLGLDYPQADDLIRASAGGFHPGGDIFIHGQPNTWAGRPTIGYDWTAGCIALADAEIDELWRVTPAGTLVEIRP